MTHDPPAEPTAAEILAEFERRRADIDAEGRAEALALIARGVLPRLAIQRAAQRAARRIVATDRECQLALALAAERFAADVIRTLH